MSNIPSYDEIRRRLEKERTRLSKADFDTLIEQAKTQRQELEKHVASEIASCELDVQFPDGKRNTITLRLSAPLENKGQWWIRVKLENLDDEPYFIAGEGSLHTLILGIRSVILRLEAFEKRDGYRYFWTGSGSKDIPFDYRNLFATVNEYNV